MTIEETKKAIEVMQAYVDGKAIQYRNHGEDEWVDAVPKWIWVGADYRIKPEPREWWVVETQFSRHVARSEPKAKKIASHYIPEAEIIHVREVI